MRMKVINPSSSTYHKGVLMHTDYFNSAGQQVPSVTTVLKIMNKDGIIEWANAIGKRGIDYKRFLENKANFGSLVHELVESDLLNKEPVVIGFERMMEEAMDMVKKFQLVKTDLQISNVQSELSLTCDTYGGTIDIICDIVSGDSNITILGDFKTTKTVYDTQFIQLGAYLNLVKINMPEVYERIKQCVIFSITSDKITMRYISREDCEKYFTSLFMSLLDVYNAWNNIQTIRNDLFKSKLY